MDVDNNVINYLSVRLRGFFAGWENISDIREIRETTLYPRPPPWLCGTLLFPFQCYLLCLHRELIAKMLSSIS